MSAEQATEAKQIVEPPPVTTAAPQASAGAFDWATAGAATQAAKPAAQEAAKAPGENPHTKKYGLRPKDYAHLFDGERAKGDGHDEVLAGREQRVQSALPRITAQLNAVAAAKGYPFRFTEAELAINFVTEGGYFLLTPYQGQVMSDTEIDGFQMLGIDTFMQRKKELTPWMSPELKARSNDASAAASAMNEKGEKVEYLNPESLEQGVEANAVMFAAARKRFSDDVTNLKLTVSSDQAWFFWTTVYYNAGEGTGKKLLQKHGVDYWQVKWTLPDDAAKYNRSAKFNAAWRTSTWESIRTALGDDLGAAKRDAGDVTPAAAPPAAAAAGQHQ